MARRGVRRPAARPLRLTRRGRGAAVAALLLAALVVLWAIAHLVPV
ncbi:hypothetical protein HS048_28665 [Planomonospora sp. ID91781]|nr:hypothetical protein [Planomonospora sp. ID91781]MBG0824685.1 hypothetical protein [Planomonospora sp. ID91781]